MISGDHCLRRHTRKLVTPHPSDYVTETLFSLNVHTSLLKCVDELDWRTQVSKTYCGPQSVGQPHVSVNQSKPNHLYQPDYPPM